MIYIFSTIILFFFRFIFILTSKNNPFHYIWSPQDPSHYGLETVKKVQILTNDGISPLSWYIKGKGKGKTPLVSIFPC